MILFDIPLGTVVADTRGVAHVFVGIRENRRQTTEYYFMPDVQSVLEVYRPRSYATAERAVAKFPRLVEYLR